MGDPVSILRPHVAHRSCPREAQRSDPTQRWYDDKRREEKQIVMQILENLSAPDFEAPHIGCKLRYGVTLALVLIEKDSLTPAEIIQNDT